MILYYNSYDIFNNSTYSKDLANIPGGVEFSTIFKMFSQNITFSDRTDTIKIPLKMHTPNFLRLPEFNTFTGKSFDQICDERARSLLDHALASNRKIAVMYSGGVDSTLILCAFLKVAKPEELKQIIVLLSEKSVLENPNFYRDYVIKHFQCESSYKFPAYMGNDKILFVTGENADQLFGSQVAGNFAMFTSHEGLLAPLSEMENKLIEFFELTSPIWQKNCKYVEPTYRLLKKLIDCAPIKIDTVYKFLWWINFTMKWQSVYVRIMPYAWNRSGIKIEENYTTFYSPADFQLWSMHNSDSLIGDTPTSSKPVQKAYILDVNGDESYLKKPKVGSLASMVTRKENSFFIDSNMQYHSNFPSEEYYNYDNDFKDLK